MKPLWHDHTFFLSVWGTIEVPLNKILMKKLQVLKVQVKSPCYTCVFSKVFKVSLKYTYSICSPNSVYEASTKSLVLHRKCHMLQVKHVCVWKSTTEALEASFEAWFGSITEVPAGTSDEAGLFIESTLEVHLRYIESRVRGGGGGLSEACTSFVEGLCFCCIP